MDTLPTAAHWSASIVDGTAHPRMAALAADGFAVLAPAVDDGWEREVDDLEFLAWRSGGDTAFAPLTSATGALDCDAFWRHGRADTDGRWTTNAERAPRLRTLVEEVGAVGTRIGRARVIRLHPQDRATALANLHRDDNNRRNPEGDGWVVRLWQELSHHPDSYLLLFDRDEAGLPRPESERRLPLPRGARVVVDSQRLWHAVVHPGAEVRHALILSVQSSPALDRWIAGQRAAAALR